MKTWLPALLLGTLAGLWEAAALPFLPSWMAVRPLLPLLVVFLVINVRRPTKPMAVIGALFIDVFAVAAPDLAVIRYLVICYVLDAVAQRWLTNRSLYTSLGLVVIGRILEQGSAWMFGTLVSRLTHAPSPWMAAAPFFSTLVWDLLIVGISFLIIAFFTRRFTTAVRPAQHTGWYGQ